MAELQKSWARGAECAREPKVQPFIYDREESPKVDSRPAPGGTGRMATPLLGDMAAERVCRAQSCL
jgi:hypothetical protein